MDMPSKLRYLPIALLIFLHHAAIADANAELIGHYSGSYETTNINGEIARWAPVIRASGARPE
jgi:hypothetical protein